MKNAYWNTKINIIINYDSIIIFFIQIDYFVFEIISLTDYKVLCIMSDVCIVACIRSQEWVRNIRL